MSIVTFYNSSVEQTGKTMSIAAIATYMAIEHNYRILIISTTNKEDALKRCFWGEKKKKKNLGIFGPNTALEIETGVEGLARVIRSNKITPDIITNYTKVVFKDRFEVLLGCEFPPSDGTVIETMYPSIVKAANQYYDLVFVDLDQNVDEETRKTIIHDSDVVVINISQRLKSINKFKEQKEKNKVLASQKSVIMVGRYDKYSKYNAKNTINERAMTIFKIVSLYSIKYSANKLITIKIIKNVYDKFLLLNMFLPFLRKLKVLYYIYHFISI